MIVLDASVVVEWLLLRPRAEQVREQVSDPSQGLHAPHLMQIKVAQVLRRIVARGEATSDRGKVHCSTWPTWTSRCGATVPLLSMIWHLRGRLSAYDAAYVALAMTLDAQLLTCDGKLARTVDRHVDVRLIS